MRRERRVEVEPREGLREVEGRVGILAREEQLRGAMHRGDHVRVVRLADDVRESDEAVRGEREPRRDELARRVAHAEVGDTR